MRKEFMPNNQTVTDEYHIASFVAHAMAEAIEDVSNAINAVEGAEVHATGETGKIVFTVEAPSQKKIGRHIDELRQHAGLLSLSPVYHQFLEENNSNNDQHEK